MKKVIVWICAALAVLLCFAGTGCAEEEPVPAIGDEEARAVLADLVPKSQKFNEIFWGDGLPVIEYEPIVSLAVQYVNVTADAAYQSIDAIKADAEKVFSSDYLHDVYGSMFGEYKAAAVQTEEAGEDEILNAGDGGDEEIGEQTGRDLDLDTVNARYCMAGDHLSRNVNFHSLTLGTEIFTETATVVSGNETYVKCIVECEYGGKHTTMSLALRLENGVWLLDSPTY